MGGKGVVYGPEMDCNRPAVQFDSNSIEMRPGKCVKLIDRKCVSVNKFLV